MTQAKKNDSERSREIAHRIRVARLALGLDEKTAAHKIGISLATLQKVEESGTALTDTVLKIADGLNLSIDWCAGEMAAPTSSGTSCAPTVRSLSYR